MATQSKFGKQVILCKKKTWYEEAASRQSHQDETDSGLRKIFIWCFLTKLNPARSIPSKLLSFPSTDVLRISILTSEVLERGF